MSKRKTREPKEENVTLGPTIREGGYAFGVAHIFASFNDTFIPVTDLSGRETLVRMTGGMKVKACHIPKLIKRITMHLMSMYHCFHCMSVYDNGKLVPCDSPAATRHDGANQGHGWEHNSIVHPMAVFSTAELACTGGEQEKSGGIHYGKNAKHDKASYCPIQRVSKLLRNTSELPEQGEEAEMTGGDLSTLRFTVAVSFNVERKS